MAATEMAERTGERARGGVTRTVARRGLLGGMAAMVTALMAKAGERTAAAADGDPVLVGRKAQSSVSSSQTTTIEANMRDTIAFKVTNGPIPFPFAAGEADAIVGIAAVPTGAGVRGASRNGGGIGVAAEASGGGCTALHARADGESGFAVEAVALGPRGIGAVVVAGDRNGTGISLSADGEFGEGTRLHANGARGTGISVTTEGAQGTGVRIRALGATGTAIVAEGKAVGVRASSTEGSGIGVHGTSGSSIGVFGASGTTAGVFGGSGSGPGVFGRSENSVGVFGEATKSAGVLGSSPIIGVFGQTTTGHGVRGVATGGGVGVFGQATGGSGLAGFFDGSVVVTGQLIQTGGAASQVQLADGSARRVYGQEATEPLIEDVGRAKLANGRADVALDPDVAAVVKGDDYLVFLTEEGDLGGLYVAARTARGFEIRARTGTASGQFGYRIVARRPDARGGRLEKLDKQQSDAGRRAEVKVPPIPVIPDPPKPMPVEAPDGPARQRGRGAPSGDGNAE